MLRLAAELILPDLKKLGCEIGPPSQLFFLDSAAMEAPPYVCHRLCKNVEAFPQNDYIFIFTRNECTFHLKWLYISLEIEEYLVMMITIVILLKNVLILIDS